MSYRQPIPLKPLKDASDCNSGDFDALVIIALKAQTENFDNTCISRYYNYIEDNRAVDEYLDKEGGFILLPESERIRRLVYSPVGPINRDYDDVRRFRDAAYRGVKRALKAGANKPLICMPSIGTNVNTYALYDVTTVLGAYEAIYTVSRIIFHLLCVKHILSAHSH